MSREEINFHDKGRLSVKTRRRSSSTKMPNQDLFCEKGLSICSWQDFFLAYINLWKNFDYWECFWAKQSKRMEILFEFTDICFWNCPFHLNEEEESFLRFILLVFGDLGTKFYIWLDQDPGYVNLNNVHMTCFNDKCDRIGGSLR